MSVTGSIMAGVGLAGSVASGAMGASAAGNAADTQSAAANHAADLQYQASQNALNFQKQQYNTSQQQMQPWLQSGQAGLSQLDYMLGLSPQSGGASSTGTGGTAVYNGGVNPVGPSSGTTGRQAMQPGAGYGTATFGGPTPLPSNGVRPASAALPTTAGASPASTVNPSLGGFGSLMQPYGQTFSAPTGLTMQNDPGYEARLNLGTDALQRSAAARGGVLTGGTAKDLNQFAQDYASNEYGNVYNRALSSFDTNFNAYNTNQTNQYNKLASLAGVGQQTAQQLGTLGNQTAQGVSSNLLSTANAMGQDYQNAGAANASGYVGAANAWGGAINNGTSSLNNLLMLKQLGSMGGSGALTIGPDGSIISPGY